MRAALVLILAILVPACTGESRFAAVQQTISSPGGGGAAPLPAPVPLPAPGPSVPPAPPVVFADDTIDLGVAGAFPSDLVVDSAGNLFTVDDAQVPFRVLGFRPGETAPFLSVGLGAGGLSDFDYTTPARTPATFGTGLFGAFSGDLALAFDRWLLVTVGGGNSQSVDLAGSPLRLANLVVIDLHTARVVQTLNLAWTLHRSGTFSNGGAFVEIPQSLPSAAAFVANRNGTNTGSVYVAMSNGAGTTAGLQTFYNGTIQVWRADFTRTLPLAIEAAGKSPVDVTRTFVSDRYNPVGLTRHKNLAGVSRLLLTSAGASLFDASFVVQPTTAAFLEVLDLDAIQWRADWEINLGPVLPAAQTVGLGRDAVGQSFGVLTSQTYAAAYLVDLHGFESNPVDPARLRLLQTVDLEPGGAFTAGTGFTPGVAVSATGRTAVLTSFTASSLTVLGLPRDILLDSVTVNPAPFATAILGPARGHGLGAVVLTPDVPADVHFVVNGDFDASFLPNRHAFLGTLTVEGDLP